MITVRTKWRNVPVTSDRKCRCGTWRQHWLNFSGKPWPKLCSVLGCSREAEVGAHVASPSVQGERIIPMCRECNHPSNTDFFELKSNTVLVRANRQLTCDK